MIALQTRTFHDDTLRGGLLYDERLASAFPDALVARQKAALGEPPVKELLGVNRFLARGYLVRNRYDVARERPGYSFVGHLDLYTRRLLPNHRWTGPLADARSRLYFEKTMRLYNDHDVTPLIVVMPYQPRVLRAFREAGFQKHLDRLAAYLRDAGTRCRFRVLDLTDIRTFGGSSTAFYDGAHATRTRTASRGTPCARRRSASGRLHAARVGSDRRREARSGIVPGLHGHREPQLAQRAAGDFGRWSRAGRRRAAQGAAGRRLRHPRPPRPAGPPAASRCWRT